MVLDSTSLGLRIAQARQRAGLTQDELASSSSVERSALAKIETGTRRVTALELARLAAAVDERIEWFVTEPTPSIISHRNMTDPGEPSPRIDNAIDRITRAVEFSARHDPGLKSTLRSVPTFPAPFESANTEALAEWARDLIGANRDDPLHELSVKLAGAGILTFVIDLGSESADAGSIHLRSGAVAVVNGILRTGRRRLALAHEFGHVLIADPYTVDWRIDDATASAHERAIDRFARALLLPKHSLASQWESWGGNEKTSTRSAAVQIASRYRVDMSTLARRLLEIRLVDSEIANYVRTIKTGRADIVEHDLVVADELPIGELPREYEAAVLRLYTSETVTDIRALDLLLDTWGPDELPLLGSRDESEIWQFVS